MDNKELIQKLNHDIIDLLESYGEKLPAYEVGYALISHATSMMLCCAPNELLGIKTVLSCVEIGITDYEQTHS